MSLSDVKCAICTKNFDTVIYLCANALKVCRDCTPNELDRDVCEGPVTTTRFVAVAKIHLCRNKEAGCSFKIMNKAIVEEHEKTCMYRRYDCGVEKCSWTGRAAGIKNHILSWHMCYTMDISSRIHQSSTGKPTFFYMFALEETFLVNFMKNSDNLYFICQYIGNPENAASYYYEIEIILKGSPKHKIELKKTCCEDILTCEEIIKRGRCITVNVTTYLPHQRSDRAKYTITVHKYPPRQRPRV